MNDIAKLKKECEEKIRRAEMENAMEEKMNGIFGSEFFDGFRFGIIGDSCTQKGKIFAHFTGKISKEKMAIILKELPATEKSKTKGPGGQEDIEMNYVLETHRSPKEPFTFLRIEWIWGVYNLWADLELLPDDDLTRAYFKLDSYTIDDSTIGLFFGAVHHKEREILRTQRTYSFNCGRQIRYHGGDFKQISEGHADCIVAEIIGE